MKKTLYDVFGVAPDATAAQIAAAYAQRQAAMADQPFDRNALIIAKEAYAVLSNPVKREMYDATLAAARQAKPAPQAAARKLSLDWRAGVALALIVGVGSGWWFSRAKVHALPAPSAAVQPEAIPAIPTESAQAPLAADLSSEDLFQQLAPSIVRINISSASGRPLGLGSGVVIAANTVITNCHVAEGGALLQVKSGEAAYAATLTLADSAHDLCRLDVPGLKAEPVTVGSSQNLRTGQKVVAIGAPKGLDLTISEGIVSSLRKVDDGTLIQTTAPVSPGSSGGGLFDLHGNLVGIVTFQVNNGQNLNFAAPAEWIDKMQSSQGNGIISKLTGPKTEPKTDVADPEARATAELPGRWSCHDTVLGTVYNVDFEPNGQMEMRKQGQTSQGRWRPVGDRIEIKPFNAPLIQVEYLKGDKLILYYGKGFRSVCTRQ
ncbi:trypsin-like peptidase domain-containing protein [Oxalobacteraceae bacterium]|nr:trypsin-like peptidase domain-containing protein [Oxalobacteraceae bacterium]